MRLSHACAPCKADTMHMFIHECMRRCCPWLRPRCSWRCMPSHNGVSVLRQHAGGVPWCTMSPCQLPVASQCTTKLDVFDKAASDCSAESFLSACAVLTYASQTACQRLVFCGLGSIVEACDSAVPFLVGSLRAWADSGAHVFLLPAHPVACCVTSLEAKSASATRMPLVEALRPPAVASNP